MKKNLSELEHWQMLEQQAQEKLIELQRDFSDWIDYTLWLKSRYAKRGEMIEKLSQRIYELTEPKCNKKKKKQSKAV